MKNKTSIKKSIFIGFAIFLISVTLGISLRCYMGKYYINNDLSINNVDTIYIDKYIGTPNELEIIRKDIQTYERFSPAVIESIIITIDSASKKYEIPVGLLHAIFRIESEYRFWIEHDQITVNGKKTRAVGLGGIVWEYWADSLKKYNIANMRTDLFLYKNNIFASAAVLHWITLSIINKNPNINYENLIKAIIKRYYGAYDNKYYNKLNRVTSDLWLKRIGKGLKLNYIKN